MFKVQGEKAWYYFTVEVASGIVTLNEHGMFQSFLRLVWISPLQMSNSLYTQSTQNASSLNQVVRTSNQVAMATAGAAPVVVDSDDDDPAPERKIEDKIRLYIASFESRRLRFARSTCRRLPHVGEEDSVECSTVVIRMGTPLANFARTFDESLFDKKFAELQVALPSEDKGEDDPAQEDSPAIDHDDGALNKETEATRFKISCRDILSGSTRSKSDRGGYRCLQSTKTQNKVINRNTTKAMST